MQLCGRNLLYAYTLRRQLPFCHSEGFHGGYQFLTSNVFSTVQCRVRSAIVSEREIPIVVPEIATVGAFVEVQHAERRMV